MRASIAKWCGPVHLGNEIARIEGVFKCAFDNALIDRPIRYGSEFKKPGKSVIRRHEAANGKNILEADKILLLMDAASVQLNAMSTPVFGNFESL